MTDRWQYEALLTHFDYSWVQNEKWTSDFDFLFCFVKVCSNISIRILKTTKMKTVPIDGVGLFLALFCPRNIIREMWNVHKPETCNCLWALYLYTVMLSDGSIAWYYVYLKFLPVSISTFDTRLLFLHFSFDHFIKDL